MRVFVCVCVSAFLAHLYLKLEPTWLLRGSPGLLSDTVHIQNERWRILFAGTQEAQSKKDGGERERDTAREWEREEEGVVKSERGPDHRLPRWILNSASKSTPTSVFQVGILSVMNFGCSLKLSAKQTMSQGNTLHF